MRTRETIRIDKTTSFAGGSFHYVVQDKDTQEILESYDNPSIPPAEFRSAYMSELIADDPGPSRKTKPCFHMKSSWKTNDNIPKGFIHGPTTKFPNGTTTYPDLPINYRGDVSSAVSAFYLDPHAVYTGNQALDTSLAPPISDGEASSILLGRMDGTEADGLMNLLESSEIGELIAPIARCGEFFYHMSRGRWDKMRYDLQCIAHGRSVKGMSRRCRSLFNRGAFKAAANHHLTYTFGIQPLVRDVRAIHESLPSFQKEFERFCSAEPRRCLLKRTVQPSVTNIPLTGGEGESVGLQYTNVPSVLHTYGLYYKVTGAKFYSNQLNKLTFIRAKYGAEGPLRLTWDIIPYSFLVEYFVNVKDMLRGIETRIGSQPYEVIDSWHSIKVDAKKSVTYRKRYGFNEIEVDAGTLEYSLYNRSSLNITSSYYPRWVNRANISKLATTVSLLLTRMR